MPARLRPLTRSTRSASPASGQAESDAYDHHNETAHTIIRGS